MSALTEKMNAALANLESKLSAGGLTADQVTAQIHAVMDSEIADLKGQLSAIAASEADAETKLADVMRAVDAFATKFAPVAPAEPAADSAPASAPDSAPQA